MKLNDLYKKIHACHLCPLMDAHKASREINAVNPYADIFVIAQSLAKGTVRDSGINWIKPDGSLGSSGKNFEAYLNKFGRTLYPAPHYCEKNGINRPERIKDFLPIYTSDMVLCYPGRKGDGKKGDRTPSKQEIKQCLDQGFLEEELKMVKPKLVILMGKPSRDSFYTHYLKQDFPHSLTNHIEEIVESKKFPSFSIDDFTVSVLPIQHSSGLNSKFKEMSENKQLIEMIQETLD